MLALDAHPLGLRVSVLTPHAMDPAAQVVGGTKLGSLSDEGDLRKFFDGLTHLTFESEFMDIPKLKACVPKSVKVFPSLKAIETIQDRLTQKRLLDRHGIPTSPWLPVENKKQLLEADRKFADGYVLKARRFGYDGYGTFKVQPPPASPVILHKSKYGFIAEEFIDFKRELAISFVRNEEGKMLSLPLVETVQKDSRCFSVHGPVEHRGVRKLAQQIHTMMEALDYVGILAVEMFETRDGLLVNELAPRVHNSAHYSQDALTCSQFSYHLRAGLGWPLPPISATKPGFAMVNLLGESKAKPKLSHAITGTLHWYGKTDNRPGRKMGHINVIDSTPRSALRKAIAWRKEFSL
jgi:5-(carboxyamino)imidazole ribonucleotide synthase